MLVRMECPCGSVMKRQPLGNWLRTCRRTRKDYWASCKPTDADAVMFKQLTGKWSPKSGVMCHYGPVDATVTKA